ncbi:TPM domain-containing protein [Sphingomicrobium sediminis]|uniref:TPM domain-containing protein n=1 Tax=Sphingomicrobium sediminis TaxID=2950949 RepID=A0A9X2EG00_9SPHN|nr:hypothetical protein [Sphingomicrobium sediminis]MCM8557308.1 hypothetical protein [Sphingomicrobium sediminis]
MYELTAKDHERVSAAISKAEEASDGEIIAVTTDLSDRYHDAGLQWAALGAFVVLGLLTFVPGLLEGMYEMVTGGWTAPRLGELMTLVLLMTLLAFVLIWLAMKYMPLRLALIPGSTKTRRVRRRAVDIYKAGAERRTIGRTGVLIYLSMGEHRAEIVHDEAITERVGHEIWGDAMIALLGPVKEGRVADGIVAAIEVVGEVLAEHFPKTSEDTNEIPDKLIEL